MTFRRWLQGFRPVSLTQGWREPARAGLGAGLGMVLTGWLTHQILGFAGIPWLIAPMGASAVLLFAAPASPLAQPWSIIGGNLVAALLGVFCARWMPDPLWAATMALSLAIGVMFWLRCLHPPSGAVALTAVLGGPAIQHLGYAFVLVPVALNSVILLVLAVAFNNLTRRAYPHPAPLAQPHPHQTNDPLSGRRLGFTRADLDVVVRRYNQVLDVNRDDLEMILRQTEMQAYQRRFGEVFCADIMAKDLVTVEFGTELEEAWGLLRRHKIRALPVVDWSKRLIGIITLADFMKHADLEHFASVEQRLRQLIRRTPGLTAEKPEVVGQIMSQRVQSVRPDLPIVDVVPLLSDSGFHHLPVVDHDRRLLGMITQSDLIAALYQARLREATA